MIEKDNEYFHPQELHLLLAASGGKEIFGLTNQRAFQMQGKTFKFADERLKKKKLFNEDGSITKKAAIVIDVLKKYSSSQKYVKCKSLTFADIKKDSNEIILLREIKKNEKYSLHVVDKLIALNMLLESATILKRDALDDEIDFNLKELTREEIQDLKATEPWNDFQIIELYDAKDMKTRNIKKDGRITTIMFERNKQLFTIDMYGEKIYRTSQHYLIKTIFNWIELRYVEVNE